MLFSLSTFSWAQLYHIHVYEVSWAQLYHIHVYEVSLNFIFLTDSFYICSGLEILIDGKCQMEIFKLFQNLFHGIIRKHKTFQNSVGKKERR